MPIVKIPLDVLAFSPKRVRLIPIKAMMSGSDDVFSCSVSEKLSFVDVLSNDDFSNAPWIIKINNININATTGTTFVGSTGGLFTLHEDQTISFDPQDDFDSLVYPNSRITAVSYVATDGIVTKYGTISVNVSSIEPVVLVAENDFGSTDTETTTSGNVLLNDDEELIEIVAVNGVSADIGLPVRGDAGGVFVIDYNGDWFFDPNDEFSGLSGEGTATTSIEYTASNGTGTTAEAVLTITISAVALPANTAPVALNDTGATTADATTSGNVLTNDTDADLDTLTVSQVSGSAANVGVAVAGSSGGLFTIGSDGAWTFDPNSEFSALTGEQTATTSVTYHVSDGVAEDEGALTVTVSAAETGDPLWSYVTFLSLVDGANNSQTFVDHSALGHTVAVQGDTKNVVPPPSGFALDHSVYFDGDGDRLQLPNDPSLNNFGSGDYCIDMFFMVTDLSAQRMLISCYSSWASQLAYFMRVNTNGSMRCCLGRSETGLAIDWNFAENLVSVNTLNYVEVSRISGVTRFFLNGVQRVSSTAAYTISQGQPVWIGSNLTSNPTFKGYIAGLRITKGAGRNSASYTPPTTLPPIG